ncbi:MAG: sigma-70 family RNA polymerase sigma factor [Puia sp.]|nr:sigma-70 family RNA polymerase sigma factor [Puia sp.]
MSTIALLNEKELARQVADGNEAAYRRLFVHYWDHLYSTALLFTKSREISQDLVQDIFARIWVKRERLREVDRFDAYLFITARNMIIDRLRKKVFTIDNEPHLTEYFADASQLSFQSVELKEMEELIHRGIHVLPNQQRTAFCLNRFGGLRHDEIALRMGVSKESVKSYIVRAISSLRKYLASHAEILPLILLALFFS